MRWALLFFLALFAPCTSRAHEGPPYPIVEDAPLGAGRVAIWVDPDVGPADLFVLYTAKGAAPPPESFEVRVVDAATGDARRYAAHRAARTSERYDARVDFPRAGAFVVLVRDSACTGECCIEARVEATPAGTPPPWALALYALPFAGVAFVWVRASRRAREDATRRAAARPPRPRGQHDAA